MCILVILYTFIGETKVILDEFYNSSIFLLFSVFLFGKRKLSKTNPPIESIEPIKALKRIKEKTKSSVVSSAIFILLNSIYPDHKCNPIIMT